MSRAISTGIDTLFFTPLSDALKFYFFFPMVMWWRAVVRVGAEVSVVWGW
jgi:hypothetical protein